MHLDAARVIAHVACRRDPDVVSIRAYLVPSLLCLYTHNPEPRVTSGVASSSLQSFDLVQNAPCRSPRPLARLALRASGVYRRPHHLPRHAQFPRLCVASDDVVSGGAEERRQRPACCLPRWIVTTGSRVIIDGCPLSRADRRRIRLRAVGDRRWQ